MNKEYSIYASGEDGSQTVAFANSIEEAETKVDLFKKELANGTYNNQTDLDSIESFHFDTLG